MPKKILIVDDEAHIVEMLKMRLEIQGYDVVTGSDGEAGLKLSRESNPDLIILDVMLPKMDGYRVCALLKSDLRYKKIPIIMFTARAQDGDIKLSKEIGADAYITKPFDPKVLLGKIEELLK